MAFQLPRFNHKWVNIALAASAGTMLVVLIICFATFGWVVDYSSLNCSFSLQEVDCDFVGKSDLTGDAKSAADAMIGLGAMAFIFICLNLCLNIVIALEKCTSYYKYMTIGALANCALAWIFLTAGWGHYADTKGGTKANSVDYGASFAFTIIVWLCLFPYAFFWVILWNQVANPDADKLEDQAGVPATPGSTGATVPAAPAAPVYTNEPSQPPAPAPVYTAPANAPSDPVASGVQKEAPPAPTGPVVPPEETPQTSETPKPPAY